jgi:hypothetical protein
MQVPKIEFIIEEKKKLTKELNKEKKDRDRKQQKVFFKGIRYITKNSYYVRS